MLLKSSKSFQTSAILILSILCLLLNYLTKINFTQIELSKHNPQYNATGMSGQIYDESGNVLYAMYSQKAWQFPNSNKIYLESLAINMYEESTYTMRYHLTSNSGWIDRNTHKGNLGNNTVLTINNNDPHQIINLYSSNIDLDLNTNNFVSNDYTYATQDNNTIYTTGFIFNNQQQILYLKSKVKVVYTKHANIL